MKNLKFVIGLILGACAVVLVAATNLSTSWSSSTSGSYTSSLSAAWQVGVDSTDSTTTSGSGPEVADTSGFTNPDTQLASETHIELKRASLMGQYIMACVQYDDGLTTVTSPVVELWGRNNSSDPWMRMKTLGGASTSTLTMNPTTDSTNGTDKFSDVNYTSNVWDTAGNEFFKFGIVTALDGTGTKTTCKILVKGL